MQTMLRLIKTGEKGWRDEMASAMSRNEVFVVVTSSEKVARQLLAHEFSVTGTKRVLWIAAAAIASVLGTLVGIAGMIRLGILFYRFTTVDQNPLDVTKATYLSLIIIVFFLLLYGVLKLLGGSIRLIAREISWWRYGFKLKERSPLGEWIIVGSPRLWNQETME